MNMKLFFAFLIVTTSLGASQYNARRDEKEVRKYIASQYNILREEFKFALYKKQKGLMNHKEYYVFIEP